MVSIALIVGCSDEDKPTISEPVLRVIATNPANSAMRVPLDQIITIEFSDTLDIDAADSTWLTVDNDVVGKVACIGKTLTFTPLEDFEYDTDYTVTASANIVDKDGKTLGSDYSWTFKSYDGTGLIWHESPDQTSGEMDDLAYGNGLYVAIGRGDSYEQGSIYTSNDGVDWTEQTTTFSARLNGIAFFNGMFIAAGNKGRIVTSIDGVTWDDNTVDTTTWYRNVVCSPERVVILGPGYGRYSENGNSWHDFTYPHDRQCSDAIWTGSQFIATTYGDSAAYLLKSADGSEWTRMTIEGPDIDSYDLLSIAASDTLIVAAGRFNTLISSTDGINWVNQDNGLEWNEEVFIQDIIWDGYQFVAVGGSHLAWGGVVLVSPDGINWERTEYFTDGIEFTAVAWSGEKLVVVSYQMDGKIFYSP